MELKDTVQLMQSDDYKDRFRAEYQQLAIRYEKLKKMVDNWDNLILENENIEQVSSNINFYKGLTVQL